MAMAMGTNELIIHNVEGGGFHRGLQARDSRFLTTHIDTATHGA
jgi:hypothetical protein